MKGLEIVNKNAVNWKISFALFLILFYQTGANLWVSEFLLSFGVPYLRLQKLIFLYAPCAFVVFESLIKNNLNVRKIYLIIFFIILHFFMENTIYKNYNPGSSIELIDIWISILIGYLALINSSIEYQKKIINYFLICSVIIYSVVYADLFSAINIVNISIGSGDFQGRLYSELNLNSVCDIGAFSIILLYYRQENFNGKYFLNIPSYLWLIFFVYLIFAQASRGSAIVLIPLILIFATKKLVNFSRIVVVLSLLVFFILADFSFNRISLFKRISNFSMNEKVAMENYDGRSLQIFSSLRNFYKSPIYGVGYKNAAKGHYYGITRSNFQYSQILASGGLILFIVYFYMNFRIFSNGIKSLLKDEFLLLFFLYVFIFYTFRRPVPFFCVIAYLVYCRKSYERK